MLFRSLLRFTAGQDAARKRRQLVNFLAFSFLSFARLYQYLCLLLAFFFNPPLRFGNDDDYVFYIVFFFIYQLLDLYLTISLPLSLRFLLYSY